MATKEKPNRIYQPRLGGSKAPSLSGRMKAFIVVTVTCMMTVLAACVGSPAPITRFEDDPRVKRDTAKDDVATDDLKREAWSAGHDLLHAHKDYSERDLDYDYDASHVKILDPGHVVIDIVYRGFDRFGNKALRQVTAELVKTGTGIAGWKLASIQDEVVR